VKEVKGAFPIVVEKISFGFLVFFEQIVEFINLGANPDAFFDLLYFESNNSLHR